MEAKSEASGEGGRQDLVDLRPAAACPSVHRCPLYYLQQLRAMGLSLVRAIIDELTF
jgi:hypothetical protein